MITLVVGTSASGKSALAEELATKTGDAHRIYLATMKVCDDAGKERVLRHRQLRKGKGFDTIEVMYDIRSALSLIGDPAESTVLLECVSNLVGNEIHDNPKGEKMESFLPGTETGTCKSEGAPEDKELRAGKENFADRVAADIKTIADSVQNLIIVTNEYECTDDYDDETKVYLQLVHMVNERISLFSDKIIDVRKGQGGEDI